MSMYQTKLWYNGNMHVRVCVWNLYQVYIYCMYVIFGVWVCFYIWMCEWVEYMTRPLSQKYIQNKINLLDAWKFAQSKYIYILHSKHILKVFYMLIIVLIMIINNIDVLIL